MIQKIIILVGPYLNYDKMKPRIGGIETYINDLASLVSKNGGEAVVYEVCEKQLTPGRIRINNYLVDFYETSHTIAISDYQRAFDAIYTKENGSDVVFVISSDQLNVKSESHNVITIQHGVSFDSIGYDGKNRIRKNRYFEMFFKMWICHRQTKMFYHSRNTVCVDYNYFNWFRTHGVIYPEYSVSVIPNYASSFISKEELLLKLQGRSSKVKIVFARRFVKYRGVLLFADLIDRFNSEGIDADFTFAGNGPYEEELKKRFSDNNNVHFTQFAATESVIFHKQYDIAVVPTLYSEGTSLSLLEAMAAGCYPLCTHVGGMTNIILDGYNGNMCYPDLDSVCASLKSIIAMPIQNFNNVVQNAYSSALLAFSKEKWEEKWLRILNSVCI